MHFMIPFKNTTPSKIVLSSVFTHVPTKVTEENIHAGLQHAKLASKYCMYKISLTTDNIQLPLDISVGTTCMSLISPGQITE